jgi:arginyl-tRNA synthetase
MSASAVDELATAVARAVAAVGGDGVPVRLDRPADPGHGDYATAVALQLAKPLRSAPRDIAARIAAAIESDHLAAVDVAGPGFLNLRVSAAWYRDAVQRILSDGPRYGSGTAATPQRIQVEYVSGNPTGPVTVATARNAAYGDSLARLFEFAGHDVGREYYFNDAGRQIDLFGESLRARAQGAEPPADGYQGEYVAAIAAEAGLDPQADAAAWARAGTDVMMAHIRATLARFRCSFDNWFLERSLYESGAVQRAMDRVRAGGHVY